MYLSFTIHISHSIARFLYLSYSLSPFLSFYQSACSSCSLLPHLTLPLSIVFPRFVWHSIVFISAAATAHQTPPPTSPLRFTHSVAHLKLFLHAAPYCAVVLVFSKGLHEYFAGIFIAFRFYALTMTISLIPLPFFFVFCSCCAVERLQGHEKRTLTITRQRAARDRQPRFYATFYDCQQWAVAEAETAAALPYRYVFYVELVSLSFALFSLHFIGQLRCVCVGCVCGSGNLLLHTYDCVSVFLCLPLASSVCEGY